MKIDWQKKGRIFAPSGEGFFKTHATRPIPYKINDHILRIFYASRDNDDRMLPTFIDVDIDKPENILRVNEGPMADLGTAGTFDDSGICPNCILDHDSKIYIYYTGWKRRRVNVTFELSIGVFEWRGLDRNFDRLYRGPILAQDKNHPFLVGGPFVMYDHNKFKMWYCSGTEWRMASGNPEPIYTVFYAESDDGINWKPYNEPVIEYRHDGEVVTAPWVIKIRDKYHMWYSARGSGNKQEKNYIIGYAESSDGIHWTRLDDQAGIKRSDSGWDSEMICYPALFAHKDAIYMFYSGNNVGKGGIGYAVAENFLL